MCGFVRLCLCKLVSRSNMASIPAPIHSNLPVKNGNDFGCRNHCLPNVGNLNFLMLKPSPNYIPWPLASRLAGICIHGIAFGRELMPRRSKHQSHRRRNEHASRMYHRRFFVHAMLVRAYSMFSTELMSSIPHPF